MKHPASILVLRFGALGDVLHALPAVASLKLSFPEARLAWVIRPKWVPLIEGNPNVDKIVPFRRGEGWRAMLHSLVAVRKTRPDVAIDFQGLIQSAVVGRLARPGTFYGLDGTLAREPLASWLYAKRIHAAGAHRIERNLHLAAAAGAAKTTEESWIPAGTAEGNLPSGPFVLASPFAGWTSKQWPLERYRQLASLLETEGLPLVLNAAPSTAKELAGFHVHTSSLSGLINATRRAAAVIGVDSGPLHLAAALRKPGVAIYGPTDPVANGPFGGSIRVIRHGGFGTSYRREREVHPAMQAVTAREVFEQLLPQLRSNALAARNEL